MIPRLQTDRVQAWRSYRTADTDALGAMICKEAVSECSRSFGGTLRSIVVTGSLARSEGTFIEKGDGWRLLGDAEFMLIFEPNGVLPSSLVLNSVQSSIEHNLREQEIHCRIDLSGVFPTYLRRLPPHVFTCELRSCGRVLWGDEAVLAMIPSHKGREISLEDAWRLLCNRMVEFLEDASALAQGSNGDNRYVPYRTLKLYLDTATSLLVFANAYAPTYRQREENMMRLAENSAGPGDWPFDLKTFAEKVSVCTAWKLSREISTFDCAWISWEEALWFARQLWRWELLRLTDAGVALSDRELLFRWMRLQSPVRRIRGWLYVLRKCGWHRSWRHWPRWARSGWRASPRHWVYAASSEFLSLFPRLLSTEGNEFEGEEALRELLCWLPVVKKNLPREESNSWQLLASEIAWNYHEFLEKTRA
jgi:hypothetical protein